MPLEQSKKVIDKVDQAVSSITKRGVIGEFREFINRGNVADLAVAFVMGAAFKTVVDAFSGGTDSPGILGGLIGAIFGGEQPDFSQKVIEINGSIVAVGAFVTAVMNFFLVSFALFLVVKFYNRLRERGDEEESTLETPAQDTTNELLVEIRDELRQALRSRDDGTDSGDH